MRRLPQPGPQAGDRHIFNQPRRRDIAEFPTADLHAGGVAVAGERIKERDDFPTGEHWERLFEKFEILQNGIGALTEQLWAQISSNILEWGYVASGTNVSSSDVGTGGSTSTLTARTSELEYITSVVAVVPSGDTGLIQLGSVYIPIGAGLSVMSPVNFPLFPSDIRSLVVTGGAGPVGLYLAGHVAPTRGKMPL